MGTERIEGRIKALKDVLKLTHCSVEPVGSISCRLIQQLLELAEEELYSVTPEREYAKRTGGTPTIGECCMHDVPVGLICEICQGRWLTQK